MLKFGKLRYWVFQLQMEPVAVRREVHCPSPEVDRDRVPGMWSVRTVRACSDGACTTLTGQFVEVDVETVRAIRYVAP
jgi:hypothetical protein